MQVKRIIAVIVLLMSAGSYFEPVLGMLRDGAVHHESPGAALAHSGAGPGEHGHEDAGNGSLQHQHDGQHQHGTQADHCAHVHGVGMTTVIVFANPDGTSYVPISDISVPPTGTSSTLLRPPKA